MDIVSVIIPAFNRRHTLEKCVHSVLNQDYEQIEVIIVDDGSTDETPRLVQRLKKEDVRIRSVAHPCNLGAQAARNTGIQNAHGEWISFLDSDDTWHSNSLSLRLGLAQQEAVSFVHSDGNVMRSQDGVLQLIGVRPLSGMVYRDLLKAPGPLFPTILVKKSTLSRIGGLDTSIVAYQEWDTSIRLAKNTAFGFVTEPTFIYDCCGDDTISSRPLSDAVGYCQIVHKNFKDILLKAGPKSIAQHYLQISRRFKRADQKWTSAYYKLLSCIWWPRISIKVGSTF